MSLNPTTRFTDRVDNYVRYRPTYPTVLIAALATHADLSPAHSVIADIGSGTGILTELLLPLAARVYAVEPNDAMRTAAERTLANDPRFASIAASAEATTLPSQTLDLITVAQAFHWFEPVATRREFARILKPSGLIALIWNERQTTGTSFLEKYETILRELAPDYARSRHTLVNESTIAAFFAPAKHEMIEFQTSQSFDLDALIGRALSSSYAPNPSHPNHEAFVAALKNLFENEAREGHVAMGYQTRMYFGRLD